MTKLTLTLEDSGVQVAQFTAEVDDVAKLQEVKAEVQKFFNDNGNQNQNQQQPWQNPTPQPCNCAACQPKPYDISTPVYPAQPVDMPVVNEVKPEVSTPIDVENPS